jgi:hypothetical protein
MMCTVMGPINLCRMYDFVSHSFLSFDYKNFRRLLETEICGWICPVNRKYTTLIKNKIKFPQYIRKFRGIGCKVI